MADRKEMSEFLAAVERRAFVQTVYAVRREEVALDIVQDAMIKLVERYHDRPPAELGPLFQSVLKTTTTDHFRRETVRNRWTTLFSALGPDDSEDGGRDILEAIESAPGSLQAESAADQVERSQTMALIEAEVKRLPARQREAFMMRYWEDMSLAETAVAMGCSEGSVKTHCSRANHALATALKAKGIAP
ncbi:MAG: RNA polymerase sigma factor [Burkholderiaceae bacterium]|nr:RNA polymerase sigma factor [Burkholderiaceae bacterium]